MPMDCFSSSSSSSSLSWCYYCTWNYKRFVSRSVHSENLAEIALKIRKDHLNTKLVISNITMRKDKQFKGWLPIDKVSLLNKDIVNLCVEHNLDLIKQYNIKRKLHLNKYGSRMLAKIFQILSITQQMFYENVYKTRK